MVNVFVIESPLQALCALEVALSDSKSLNIVVVNYSGRPNSRNDKQIERLVKKINWHSVYSLSSNRALSIFFHRSVAKVLGDLSVALSEREVNLFIGEFRSPWMHFFRPALKPKETFLIDDGAAIINVKRKFIDKGVYFPLEYFSRRIIKRFTYWLSYYNYSAFSFSDSPINICSTFSGLNFGVNDHLISFDNVRSIFNKKSTLPSDKVVLYFGSKFSEAGMWGYEDEIQFLWHVKKFYESKDMSIIYFPHREESSEKVDVLRDQMKMSIKYLDEPAEAFLLQLPDGEYECAAVYSSVLNSFRVIFPDRVCRAFRPQPHPWAAELKPQIEEVYSYYESIGVEVVEVSL